MPRFNPCGFESEIMKEVIQYEEVGLQRLRLCV